MDNLARNTGLEFVSWVLVPGQWVKDETRKLWDRYVHLVGVQEENERLQSELEARALELARLKEAAQEVKRLRRLMSFAPPDSWIAIGARVLSQRLGPNAALESVMVDQGYRVGAVQNTPAITHNGVVGRVLRSSPNAAIIILLTDPSSRVAVSVPLENGDRVMGILRGRGAGRPLKVLYVPRNMEIARNGVLVTSGMAGLFPKGLPVARITRVEDPVAETEADWPGDDDPLFLSVCAELVDYLSDPERTGASLETSWTLLQDRLNQATTDSRFGPSGRGVCLDALNYIKHKEQLEDEDPLFQNVWAELSVDVSDLEEVILLKRRPRPLVFDSWMPRDLLGPAEQ